MASQNDENIRDLTAAYNQEESHAQLSKTLSNKLSKLNLKVPSLSSVALKGDDKVGMRERERERERERDLKTFCNKMIHLTTAG